MLTIRYDPDNPERPVVVTAENETYRLTVEDAERLADELDEALAWAGRPLQPRGWWSLAQYKPAQRQDQR
jgi:hypothetical protein